jgi:hypothetical protein
MSEWWTYRPSDFILFSSETYRRLFELYNRDLWPLHFVALAAGVAVLVLVLRRSRGRVVAAILAAAWLWVAWAFHLERYATIQIAARWFAAAFALEALLLVWTGVVHDRFRSAPEVRPIQRMGLGLFAFALFVEPLIGPLIGRDWTTVELFGLAPDPTAVATLGVIVFASDRIRWSLLVIPLLWCAVSATTLWAMREPDALVLPVAGAIALALAVWRQTGGSRPA